MLKILSSFVLLMPVAIVWIHTRRIQVVAALMVRGVPRLLPPWLHLLPTPRLVVLALLVLRRLGRQAAEQAGASIGKVTRLRKAANCSMQTYSYFVCDDARQD